MALGSVSANLLLSDLSSLTTHRRKKRAYMSQHRDCNNVFSTQPIPLAHTMALRAPNNVRMTSAFA